MRRNGKHWAHNLEYPVTVAELIARQEAEEVAA